ncbi:MAG: pantoate--beta-alanine ligase, partial [Sutterella sp.]|nr:pantoate--beta-alanine ligase [Sutterella sp.]
TRAAVVLNAMQTLIEGEPLALIDYVSAVSLDTLMPVTEMRSGVLTAMAVYIGRTRLIDNFIIR